MLPQLQCGSLFLYGKVTLPSEPIQSTCHFVDDGLIECQGWAQFRCHFHRLMITFFAEFSIKADSSCSAVVISAKVGWLHDDQLIPIEDVRMRPQSYLRTLGSFDTGSTKSYLSNFQGGHRYKITLLVGYPYVRDERGIDRSEHWYGIAFGEGSMFTTEVKGLWNTVYAALEGTAKHRRNKVVVCIQTWINQVLSLHWPSRPVTSPSLLAASINAANCSIDLS